MRRIRLITDANDQGVAIVITVAIAIVALAFSLVVVKIAMREDRAAGVDRQRAVAVNAAEAGVDATFTAFQSSGTTLPCGDGAFPSIGTNVPGDAPVIATVVQYFKADGVTPMTCAEVQANTSGAPMKALVTATATTRTLGGGTTTATRTMQSFVTLRPKFAQGFDKAIFANGTLTVNNNHEVFGNQGNDADIYSNTDVVCPNGSNQTYHGRILSQGKVTFTGQCKALGDIWANGAVTLNHNQTTVAGRVVSSTSSVKVADVSKVTGTITAGTTVDPSSCPASKCVRGLKQGPPPYQPFPQMPLSQIGDWVSAGYERLADYTSCTSDGVAVGDKMVEYAKLGGQGRVIYTPCAVQFSKTHDIAMKNDLVIYAKGGFATSNQVTFTSGDSQQHKIYWIVPSGSTCKSTAPTGDITSDNNFTVKSKVDLMMYTPCNISVSNNADHFGQVYGGGSVSLDNKFDMYFKPLPMLGIDKSSLPLASYDVDIIYKREVRS